MHNAVNCPLVDRFTRFIEQIIVLFMVYVGKGIVLPLFISELTENIRQTQWGMKSGYKHKIHVML